MGDYLETGQVVYDDEATPAGSPAADKAPSAATSFAQAFRAARAEKGAGKTFTWAGKKFTTNIAGEGASRPQGGRSGTGGGGRGGKATPAVSAATSKFFSKLPTIQSTISKMRGNSPAATPRATRNAPVLDTSKDTSTRLRAAAAEAETSAAQRDKDIKAPAGRNVGAKLADKLGFSSSERRSAQYLRDQADVAGKREQRQRWADVKSEGDKAGRLERMRRAAYAPGASRMAKDEYKYALESGMYRKGGKIDGCAVRGKTRASMK